MTVGDSGPSFVLCGNNPLIYSLAVRLTTLFTGASVTAVLPDRSVVYVPRLAELDRVRIIWSARLDESTLRAAGVAEARALALVDSADVDNFHAALRAQELNPDIRLVIRMFNTGLGFRIRQLFADCVVMSMSEMAAPSFIAAALGEQTFDYLRLAERTLYIAASGDVGAGQIVCGLGTLANPGVESLVPAPGDDPSDGITLRTPSAPAERVLALAVRVPPTPPSRRTRWLGTIRYLMRHSLIRLLMALLGMIALGCGLLVAIGTSWGAAVYETLLDAAGSAAPEPEKHPVFKVLQLTVTFTGLAVTPVITALVVGGVLRSQLTEVTGPDPASFDDHVVVAGMGNVGMRVLEQLSDLGVRVVGLDHDENARGVALARTLGIPVVIGRATWEDTLRAAGVARARALVVATSSDAVNLEAALLGQSIRDDLRVVLRLSDDDLAERVQNSLGKVLARSVFQLAADGFAAAMAERGVIATLTVGGAKLLVAEIPVLAGSVLAGQPVTAAELPGRTRVLALQRAAGFGPQWQPGAETVLSVGNQLVVVSTREGLDELRRRGAGGLEPEPVVA